MAAAGEQPCGPLVALGTRLRRFESFITLGVKPNFLDYTQEERELILAAPRIYYPSLAYASLLHTLGKELYPSLSCHVLAGDKIKQSRALQLLGLPHPRTKVFFGNQRARILDEFDLPLVAKTPRASALGRGVYMISSPQDLTRYLERHNPAYIQEYLPMERDIRVVVIGEKAVCSYWRQAQPGEFRHNLARGARLDFEGVPPEAVELALKAARLCGLNEVGLDLAWHEGQASILEFNMKFGLAGPSQAGMDIPAYVAGEILQGRL